MHAPTGCCKGLSTTSATGANLSRDPVPLGLAQRAPLQCGQTSLLGYHALGLASRAGPPPPPRCCLLRSMRVPLTPENALTVCSGAQSATMPQPVYPQTVKEQPHRRSQ